MQEQSFLTAKDTLGYAEEYIVINGTNKLLNYSLSNSIDDIEIAIFARTGYYINLKKAFWCFNSKLSISVKHLMKVRNVNYSMTIIDIDEKEYRGIIVNMRVGDKWFYTYYSIAENGTIRSVESIVEKFFDDCRKAEDNADDDFEDEGGV